MISVLMAISDPVGYRRWICFTLGIPPRHQKAHTCSLTGSLRQVGMIFSTPLDQGLMTHS